MRLRLSWPWRRRRLARSRASELDAELDVAHREVDRALIDAEQLHSRANAVGDRLHRTRTRNHIAEAVEESIRRARHT